MTGAEQFVLVGVARARERWSSDLARWSTSGAAPIEFVKCLTADEARAVLGSGRRASALLLDARGPGVDRELIAAAAEVDVPTIVVSDGSVHRDWEALGCAAVVDHGLELHALLDVLQRHTVAVDRTRRPGRTTIRREGGPRRGRLVTVVGSGGAGATTVAMATAQALARTGAGFDRVVVVDGARRGTLAMYHDVGDVIPGLPELVEAHRSDRLDPEAIRDLTFEVPARGYSVLLGRRRVADWVTLRRRAVAAATDGLQRSFDLVVMDVDGDVDGQTQTGAADVEDRHAASLSALEVADLVLAVGRAGLHGVHSLVALSEDLLEAGVPAHRLLPVVIGGRSTGERSSITATVGRLLSDDPRGDGPALPVLHLRHVRGLDDTHDRVRPLPRPLCQPLGRQVAHLLDTLQPRPHHDGQVDRVRPGELGVADERAVFGAGDPTRSTRGEVA